MEEKKIGTGKPGPGRPKGSGDKISRGVKEMVIAALNGVGGQAYLEEQAVENPKAFLTLVGRVIPLQADHSGDVVMTVITGVPRGDTSN
ncbi:MAG: hypothetical protein IPN56_14375 [Chitinophagaceae bacterium]|nr:hypothetical protein [Chitinophagaceae bacterium]